MTSQEIGNPVRWSQSQLNMFAYAGERRKARIAEFEETNEPANRYLFDGILLIPVYDDDDDFKYTGGYGSGHGQDSGDDSGYGPDSYFARAMAKDD